MFAKTKFLIVLLCQAALSLICSVKAFSLHRRTNSQNANRIGFTAKSLSKSNDQDDDVDWRAFRAQLVKSETSTNEPPSIDADTASTHWAYDSGDFVEPGSIVISIPSSDPIADDIDALNNQCYRKCIVLVLDVKNNFIQGIILNRPTNICVADGMKLLTPQTAEDFDDSGLDSCADSPGSQWKVWFGGESFGPYSDSPQVLCLHSVQSNLALDVSKVVMPGILLTPFEGAQAIVNAGDGKPSDFWLFCGICGWETSSFYREMHNEGLWKLVSSDGGTILKELNLQRCEEEQLAADKVCDVDSDSRNAGIHTWEMLMDMIGKEDEKYKYDDSFGDSMLRCWATGALSFTDEEQSSSNLLSDGPLYPDARNDCDESSFDITDYDPTSLMSVEPLQSTKSEQTALGTMVRASSASRSPFLLSDQCFHKSLVLILSETDECSTGVALHLITDKIYSLFLEDGEEVELAVRYGGPVQEDEDGEMLQLTFLHANNGVAKSGIGQLVSAGIYKCTEEEVAFSISNGFACADDFMAIQGLSIWKKRQETGLVVGGVLGDIEEGFFEPVPVGRMLDVWHTLMQGDILSDTSLDKNMALIQAAWRQASISEDTLEEESKILVFGSDIDVAAVADEALRRWINANLLS